MLTFTITYENRSRYIEGDTVGYAFITIALVSQGSNTCTCMHELYAKKIMHLELRELFQYTFKAELVVGI